MSAIDEKTQAAIAEALRKSFMLGVHEGMGSAAVVAKGSAPGVKLNDSRRDVPQRYRDLIAAEILEAANV